ncbi:hypothetical protein V8F20_001574 [Naviculisporaceae sp. PSN 640]
MNYLQLTQTLSESFNALADEVQSLIDRKTILEHKLRYAHEQYQYLADKYAPGVSEVSETLAKLQLPPDVHPHFATTTSVVPLPRRGQAGTEQHQIALLIREGRKAVQQLAVNMGDVTRDSGSSKEASSSPDSAVTMTSVSTALEKDFTVPGKKSHLACPFSPSPVERDEYVEPTDLNKDGAHHVTGPAVDPASPHASDPICAAMLEEKTSAPPAAASKCPIRFLDKHSPEEIAHYVETHKHEIPRSHEICVRRYQRNEEQIRKLDAKYGSLVGMINDLSQLHRPMLPSAAAGGEPQDEVDRASNRRVENWAKAISSGSDPEEAPEVPVDEEDRQGHFDRPLRDVRLGESPSRPWGIPVPFDTGTVDDPTRPGSPSPRPVRMQSTEGPQRDPIPEPDAPPRKCPFDHTKLPFAAMGKPGEGKPNLGTTDQGVSPTSPPEKVTTEREQPQQQKQPAPRGDHAPQLQPVSREAATPAPPLNKTPLQPTFINTSDLPIPPLNPEAKSPNNTTTAVPQVVFNISGPVFIGYPVEQALQFLQRFQGQGQNQGQQ